MFLIFFFNILFRKICDDGDIIQKLFYWRILKKMSGRFHQLKNKGMGMSTRTKIFFGVVLAVIIIAGILTQTEQGKSTFSNVKSMFAPQEKVDLAGLDIMMFYTPKCPWCKKMREVIRRNNQTKNITMVDVTTAEGIKTAQQYGADKQPVPSFLSRTTKVGTVGYREKLSDLVRALTVERPPPDLSSQEPGDVQPVSEGGEIIGTIGKLQIVLFSRQGCPYCAQAAEAIEQAGVRPVIQVIDITTPEGKQMASQLLPPNVNGVPAWVSLVTKKVVVGFKPIDQIIQEIQ